MNTGDSIIYDERNTRTKFSRPSWPGHGSNISCDQGKTSSTSSGRTNYCLAKDYMEQIYSTFSKKITGESSFRIPILGKNFGESISSLWD